MGVGGGWRALLAFFFAYARRAPARSCARARFVFLLQRNFNTDRVLSPIMLPSVRSRAGRFDPSQAKTKLFFLNISCRLSAADSSPAPDGRCDELRSSHWSGPSKLLTLAVHFAPFSTFSFSLAGSRRAAPGKPPPDSNAPVLRRNAV